MQSNIHQFRGAQWLFLGPALIHLVWAWCVLRSPVELKTTGLYDLYRICGHDRWMVGGSLIAVAVAAIVSIFMHKYRFQLSFWLMIPQQSTMLVSAFTAFVCIRDSRFADGLPYDGLFIGADQSYIFIIGGCHTALIIHVYIWDSLVEIIRDIHERGIRL